jgi:hypothetical protein
MRHAEKIGRITEARTIDSGGYYTIEVDYVTTGGVKKTLVMPHCIADIMRVSIIGEIECMTDEARKRSFFASFKRKRN